MIHSGPVDSGFPKKDALSDGRTALEGKVKFAVSALWCLFGVLYVVLFPVVELFQCEDRSACRDAHCTTESFAQLYLPKADIILGLFFTAEWLSRSVLSGSSCIRNPWHICDGALAALPVAIALSVKAPPSIGLPSKASAIIWRLCDRGFRLARLAQLLSRYRTSNKCHIQKWARVGQQPLESPAEMIVDILQVTAASRGLDEQTRQDLLWAAEVINSDALYQPHLRIDKIATNASSVEAAEGWIESALTFRGKRHGSHPETRYDCSGLGGGLESPFGPLLSPERAYHTPGRTPIVLTLPSEDWLNDEAMVTARFDAAPNFTENAEAASCLSRLNEWDFPLLELDKATNGNSLCAIADSCLERLGLVSILRLDQGKWRLFLDRIQFGYPNRNFYHNHLHAADVVQTTFWLLTAGDLMSIGSVNPVDTLSLLLAAAIHDYDHPGVNNVFLMMTNHPLAVRYNDTSVLENHHCASSFELLQNQNYTFFPAEIYRAFRQTVITAVLATDISCHFSEIGRFKARQKSPEFLKENNEDGKLLLNICLHAADIANSAKAIPTALYWASLVMQEFFEQGDQERAAGLEVSKFYDRQTTNIAKCQLGFISVLVQPLYEALQATLPAVAKCTRQLEETRGFWNRNINYMEDEMRRGTHRLPPVACSDGGSTSGLSDAGDNRDAAEVSTRAGNSQIQDGDSGTTTPRSGRRRFPSSSTWGSFDSLASSSKKFPIVTQKLLFEMPKTSQPSVPKILSLSRARCCHS